MIFCNVFIDHGPSLQTSSLSTAMERRADAAPALDSMIGPNKPMTLLSMLNVTGELRSAVNGTSL